MARLPTAQDLGQRPTPQVNGNISRLQLSTPDLSAEARAETQFGQVITGVGDTVAALALREKQKVDNAQKLESSSNYQDSLLNLEYGQQDGFVNIKGGDAVKQPLVGDYRTRRDAIKGQIRDGLQNDEQKIGFDNQAKIMDQQFDARLYRHVAEQSNVYQDNVHAGLLATERKAAALNWDQPGQIEMSILRSNMEVERKGRQDGMPSDAIDTMKTVAQTQIHSDVINQMLSQGKDAAAAAYYNQMKDDLTPEAVVLLGAKVQSASVEGEAIRGADVIWGALGPKAPNDPVRLDLIEAWARDKYKDNPKEMQAAIQDLRSRAVAHNDGQHEYSAANQASVLDAYHNGADLKTLQTMPEYQNLNGEEKVKLRDYIVNRGWSDQQHARSEAQYREGEKSSQGFSTYWELSNPQVLSTMSEPQILKMEPVIGQKLTQDLMEGKRKLSNPSNLKEANIDSALFNTVASDAGLKPFDKNIDPKQKEYLGRLKNEVDASIDVAQRQGGRTLNRDEKEKLMRGMVDKKVMVDEWGKDPSLPAPVIRPDQRSKVYVPIDQIDGTWMKGAINYMRSSGTAPMDWDDAKIKQGMKGRLERAYAISITGGSSIEGQKALEGADQ